MYNPHSRTGRHGTSIVILHVSFETALFTLRANRGERTRSGNARSHAYLRACCGKGDNLLRSGEYLPGRHTGGRGSQGHVTRPRERAGAVAMAGDARGNRGARRDPRAAPERGEPAQDTLRRSLHPARRVHGV